MSSTLAYVRRHRLSLAGLVLASAPFIAGACTAGVPAPTSPRQSALSTGAPGDVDILFMVDDSSSMTGMQAQMLAQIPAFVGTLAALPNGLPNVHVAVVSSDMGAPSNVELMGCNNLGGDNGLFHAAPMGSCTSSGLACGDSFISDVAGVTNFSGNLADVLGCISPLGESGCGFEHQLASVARALGADGQPVPAQDVGFLRPDAALAVILLTNEDDCSAPPNTGLYNLNTPTGANDISDPQGPIANYRCNQFGHLCDDPNGKLEAPPLNPPAGARAGATLAMTACRSNESGPLLPVAGFVDGVRALKADPDSQILVAAIAGPTTPYTIAWEPGEGSTSATEELWPQIEHACGDENTDGTGIFADPGVRVAEWVQGFGGNGIGASICDPSYAQAFTTIANRIGVLIDNAPSDGSLVSPAAAPVVGVGGPSSPCPPATGGSFGSDGGYPGAGGSPGGPFDAGGAGGSPGTTTGEGGSPGGTGGAPGSACPCVDPMEYCNLCNVCCPVGSACPCSIPTDGGMAVGTGTGTGTGAGAANGTGSGAGAADGGLAGRGGGCSLASGAPAGTGAGALVWLVGLLMTGWSRKASSARSTTRRRRPR